MARERADCSYDLFPYLKTFRNFKDVKYSFSSDKVNYRKRKGASRNISVSGAKVCHEFIISQYNIVERVITSMASCL